MAADCELAGLEHGRHYLGRDSSGVPRRCEGEAVDHALTGDSWRETGWTGL